MPVSHSTTASFPSDVLTAEDDLVVVDFWATWCGPCRQIAPILEAFSDENADRVKVVKVDVDENPELAQTYGIMSIPTLIFFKNGEAVNSMVGAVSKGTLTAAADSLL